MVQRNQAKLLPYRAMGVAIAVLSLFVPLLLSGMGFLLSLWVVIPAPTLALLPLAVGAPEVSPWLLGVNAIALVLAILGLPKGWLYSLALGLSAIGLIVSALPLLQLPTTNSRFAAQMHSSFGDDYLQLPISTAMRRHPFVWEDCFRGIALGDVRISRGIPFAAPQGVTLRLNIYRPMQMGQHPAIVVIYGGAWRHGTPDNDEAFSRYMAAQGYTVVAIDYRHAPTYPFPAQIEDVKTALAYIQQHANDLEVALDRVAVMGRSAGAHLAMLAAYQPGDFPIRAVVNYYGPVDLTLGYQDPPVPDPIDTRAVLRSLLGGTPTERPSLYQTASPITYVNRPLPPSLLIYGARDHLVQAKFGRTLYTQLQTTGTPTALLEIPWAEHAFDAVFSGVSNQLALYYTERFLASTLKD